MSTSPNEAAGTAALLNMKGFYQKSFCRLVLCATLFASIAGCGLAEYEAQMEKAQKHLEYIDKENQYLGEAIELPPPEKAPPGAEPKSSPKIDLFFRPPKGFLPKYEATPVGNLLYRYPRDAGSRPHPGGSGKQAPEFQELLVAISTDRSRDDFWKEILVPFAGVDTNSMTRETKQPLGRATMLFDKLAFDVMQPPARYLIYVYQVPPSTQIAVIFNLKPESAGDAQVTTAMDYSLKSLAVGPEAALMRQRYHPAR
jgi:hypothetical protein